MIVKAPLETGEPLHVQQLASRRGAIAAPTQRSKRQGESCDARSVLRAITQLA